MKCPHCQVDFFDQWYVSQVSVSSAARLVFADHGEDTVDARARSTTCPSCKKPTVQFWIEGGGTSNKCFEAQIFPRSGQFRGPPPEVPTSIAGDYIEANEVLSVSPKASAALSRRCLQSVLATHGYSGRDLVKQIESVLTETDTSKALPSGIKANLDAIRNFGNFSAHPITDQTTLQVIEVEVGEAEWCLEILLDLFDHFYVAPALAAKKRVALGLKLAAAGKPPMKS